MRHLILLDGFIPSPSTESSHQISALESLNTLTCIQDFKCSERVLQMIPNLNKLGMTYTYEGTYEIGWSEYSLNNLVHLHKLEKLRIYAEPYPNLKNEVLSENISFPVTLKKLSLSGCRFPWKDMKMIGSLPNLQKLNLMRHACAGTEWETREEEFPQLKMLLIEGSDLHEWVLDSSSMPNLQHLILYDCKSLREVPNTIGDIPTLELIEVDIRNLSVVASVKCIEEEQQSLGNDLLQVRLLKSWSKVSSKDCRYDF